MPEIESLGGILILTGGILLLLGVVVLFGIKIPLFGNLPGDIFIEKENFKFYAPITTFLIISVILTLLVNFLSKT